VISLAAQQDAVQLDDPSFSGASFTGPSGSNKINRHPMGALHL